MPARSRRSGRTKYDNQHRKNRAAALASFVEGVTCCPFPSCPSPPMYLEQGIDLDHTYGVLAHAHCNRSHGARWINRRRRKPPENPSRNW